MRIIGGCFCERGIRVLLSTCLIAQGSKTQIRASILKDQEITVVQIGQAKSVFWTYDFQCLQEITFSFWGK